MKKVLSIAALLLTTVMVTAACGSKEAAQPAAPEAGKEQSPAADSQGSENGEKPLYFVNPKSIGYAYWDLAQKGAEAAGTDVGAEVVFNGTTDVNSAKQIDMIEDMMTRGATGMVVAPNDAKAVASVFSRARAQGINVITFDSDAPDTERQYYVGADTDQKLAEQLIDIIAEDIGGKGKIAFMVAGLGAENQIAKMDAAKAKLEADYPDIELVATVSSNDEMQVSLTNAQNLLKTYPDLKGIVGFAGGEAPSAAEAVEQAVNAGELEAGQVKITGIGWPNMCRDYIKNGTINKVLAWQSETLGYAGVYLLDCLDKGIKIEGEMKMPNGKTITIDGPNAFTGLIVISKDNVDDYDF